MHKWWDFGEITFHLYSDHYSRIKRNTSILPAGVRETDARERKKEINLNNCHSRRVISSHMVEIKISDEFTRVSPQEYHVQPFISSSVSENKSESSSASCRQFTARKASYIFAFLLLACSFFSLATNPLLVTVDASKCSLHSTPFLI